MRDGEGGRRKLAHLLHERFDEHLKIPDHIVFARINARDIATRAERAALATQQQCAHICCRRLVVGR